MAPPDLDLGRFTDPAVLILSSLAAGERHGYAIIQDVEALSGARMGPGTLYGALARLEQRGLVEGAEPEGRRRPYRLTPEGRRQVGRQLAGMRAFAQAGLDRLATA